MKRLRLRLGVFLLVLSLAWITACGIAQSGDQGLSTTTITRAPQTMATSIRTTSTLSPEESERRLYGKGAYMGFWAENVETIPANRNSLPVMGPFQSA